MLTSETREDGQAAVAIVFAFALMLTLGYLAANGWSLNAATPLPVMHDEFAVLLGADTFLHGRLANEPPPIWQSIQTFHVLLQPTYAPKYPPGNAALLALGIKVAGSPIVAVWLAFALGCSLLTWAAIPFVGKSWSIVGGLVAALTLGSTYWVSSYWGGSLAFAGGALVLGSTRQLWDTPSSWLAVAWAIGIGVLATTRPYEGFVLAAISAGALSWRAWSAANRQQYLVAAIPAMGLLLLLAVLLAVLNHAVTGSATTLPYSAYDSQYGIPPAWIWAAPRAPQDAPFAEMQRFLEWAYAPFNQQRSWDGLLAALGRKLTRLGRFFLPGGLAALLLMVPFCRRDRWIHALALLTAIGLFAVLAVVWVHPHYAAPFVAPLAILYLAAARRLSEVRIGLHRVGWILVLAIGVRWTMIGVQKYGIALSLSDIKHRPAWVAARMRLQDELTQDPTAKHVVIVRYGAEHDVHEEWVYNSADLPTQPVIFARDLGPELNARLAMHFSDRTVWIVHVTNDPRQVRLEPLEASSRPSVNQDGSPASRASRVSTEIK